MGKISLKIQLLKFYQFSWSKIRQIFRHEIDSIVDLESVAVFVVKSILISILFLILFFISVIIPCAIFYDLFSRLL